MSRVFNLKDSALVVLAAATLAASGISTSTVNVGPNGSFDLALGAQLQNGEFLPNGGGQQMNLVVPVTAYNASSSIAINASGGTYTLSVTNYLFETPGTGQPSYNTQTTTALAYNANAATIATALSALTNVGNGSSGLVAVTGTGPYAIAFNASLGGVSLTDSGTALTGGGIVLSAPTYSFVVNESPDGVNWQPASRVMTIGATSNTDFIAPSGGALQMSFTARWRYIQLAYTIAGNAPGIVLQDCFVTPFVNAV